MGYIVRLQPCASIWNIGGQAPYPYKQPEMVLHPSNRVHSMAHCMSNPVTKAKPEIPKSHQKYHKNKDIGEAESRQRRQCQAYSYVRW
jgi:hypothetical protein